MLPTKLLILLLLFYSIYAISATICTFKDIVRGPSDNDGENNGTTKGDCQWEWTEDEWQSRSRPTRSSPKKHSAMEQTKQRAERVQNEWKMMGSSDESSTAEEEDEMDGVEVLYEMLELIEAELKSRKAKKGANQSQEIGQRTVTQSSEADQQEKREETNAKRTTDEPKKNGRAVQLRESNADGKLQEQNALIANLESQNNAQGKKHTQMAETKPTAGDQKKAHRTDPGQKGQQQQTNSTESSSQWNTVQQQTGPNNDEKGGAEKKNTRATTTARSAGKKKSEQKKTIERKSDQQRDAIGRESDQKKVDDGEQTSTKTETTVKAEQRNSAAKKAVTEKEKRTKAAKERGGFFSKRAYNRRTEEDRRAAESEDESDGFSSDEKQQKYRKDINERHIQMLIKMNEKFKAEAKRDIE